MSRTSLMGRRLSGLLLCSLTLAAATTLSAEEQKPLREPIFRVAKNIDDKAIPAQPRQSHPLDPALRIAYEGLAHMRANVRDYEATMVKRERINGELSDTEFMYIKVRNRKTDENGNMTVPLSVYIRFLKPKDKKGREVIWVENANNGKLVAHGTGPIEGLIRVNLDPNGWMAMKGNRYPVTEAGVQNLVEKLIEKGERDRQRGECEVDFYKNAKINERSCTLIQVTHPVPRPYFDFHVARIFIDDELQVPVRYAAWVWPTTAGGKPVLEEEYTYMNVKVNIGLTDADFDPNNPNYEYP